MSLNIVSPPAVFDPAVSTLTVLLVIDDDGALKVVGIKRNETAPEGFAFSEYRHPGAWELIGAHPKTTDTNPLIVARDAIAAKVGIPTTVKASNLIGCLKYVSDGQRQKWNYILSVSIHKGIVRQLHHDEKTHSALELFTKQLAAAQTWAEPHLAIIEDCLL